ncbi:MAG: VOC family protein [Acidobacteriota bacterium]
MMKISHAVYKVADLDEAVKRYRDDGFDVQYGKADKPYNALAYFADGSYFELLAGIPMPGWANRLLRLFGKRAFAERISSWQNADEGLIGLALECETDRFDETKKLLKDSGHKYFSFRSKRSEPSGRVLKFAGVMPDEMKIPFFGTCDTDLKREGFVHPNGVVGYKSISFGTTEELMPLVQRLCSDDRLHFFVGDGVKDLEFDYEAS